MRDEPAQMSITAADLDAAYAQDEAAATSRYHGKVLEVTGVINNTQRRSSRGKLAVTLQGSEPTPLTCYFLESEADAVTGLTEGQTVTVKGRDDTSHWFLIILRDCVVIRVGEQQSPRRQVSQQAPTEPTGCFVATTVYGNVDHPDVRLLREFRDEVLLSSALGRSFVGSYYRISPVLVALARTESVKSIVKALILRPIILFVTRKLDKRSE